MIELSSASDLTRLRRIALGAQGLLSSQPFGRGSRGARRAIDHLGYVQIDTISVVERAHHHVLHSRVPGFAPPMTEQLLRSGEVFEYWSHAAAFLPMADYRYTLPYKQAIRNGKVHWYRSPDRKLMQEVLARIRSDGALRSRDLEARATRGYGWWDWKPTKKALEQLFMEGELMVSSREGFQKTYDLTERVLPDGIDTSVPSAEEFATHLVDQQLRCHGLVSLKGLTYLRRDGRLRKAVKLLVEQRVAAQELERLRLPNGEVFIANTGILERRSPRANERMLILSPFDNSVIQRDRLKSLFDFDYQLECYVPEAKRRYGYFSLPLLFRDAFIGRVDCKAHRKSRHLEIKSLHLEPQAQQDERMILAFADAIRRFSRFQRCDSVSLKRTQPASIGKALMAALDEAL